MRGKKVTNGQLKRFIKALEKEPNVAAACRAAKIGIRTAYDYRDSEAPEYTWFAEAWDEALELGLAELEGACYQRATKGVFAGYQATGKGELVKDPETGEPIKLYKFSDTIAIQLLKAYRPNVYGDKKEDTPAPSKIEIIYANPVPPAWAQEQGDNSPGRHGHAETDTITVTGPTSGASDGIS
jgi:hypothetical protein